MEKQRVVVIGFLLNEDLKVLVVRRSKKSKILPKYYELPGGKVEFREEPEAALQREFLEETGLKVRICNPFHVCSYDWEQEASRQSIAITYFVQPLRAECLRDIKITLSDEHSDYKWANMEMLKLLKIHENARKAIEFGLRSCCK